MRKLTEKQQELVTANIPMVKYLANKLGTAYYHLHDEFESEGYLGLIQAALGYDYRDLFAKYASKFVRGHMLNVLRQQRKSIPLHDNQYFLEEGEYILMEFETEDQNLHLLDDLDAVEVRLKKLPERFREVCTCIYLYGMSQVETALKLNISQAHTSVIHTKALRMLDPHYDGTI